jgi:glycosyltransferase involved in cell wall biosynthesis
MASGVPVVAMARGGPKFVAAGSDGARLALDEGELIDAAHALVRDPARRRVMASAARAWALDHSWDQIFDGVYRAYAVAASLVQRSPEVVPESLASMVE